MRKFTKKNLVLRPRTSYEDLYADGTVKSYHRNRQSTYVRQTIFFTNSWRSEIALESCFDDHVSEVCEITWKNREYLTTLLNAYPPKVVATILKVLREQLKENDQLNAVEEIAGPAPDNLSL